MNTRTKTKAAPVAQADILDTPSQAVAAYHPPAQDLAQMPTESPFIRIIERAMEDRDFDVDKMKELLAAKEKWDANEARKAYDWDMALLKASEPLQVIKDKTVTIKHKNGPGRTVYDQATIGNVVAVATGAMGRFGFSHRWDTIQEKNAEGKTVNIIVHCIVKHRLGHFEVNELQGPPDTSGSKNPLQEITSTQTFLQRYTLLGALGMATMDQPDNFGNDNQDESNEEEQRLIEAWKKALAESETLEILQAHKAKFISDYRGLNNVPEEIRNAYTDRLHIIAPANA